MRSKREKPSTVPDKFARNKPSEWPGGSGDWVTAREKWNTEQEPVVISGVHHDGRPYSYLAGPLSDRTSLVRARIEARMLDAYTGGQ